MRVLACVLLLAACSEEPPYVEPRQPCAQHDPLKQVYYGDLHVHTSYSFDAYLFDVRNTPFDAYRFARGEALALPPLGPDGKGTRSIRLDRPLDFAAVTDHSEFLGEVEACTLPESPAFNSSSCRELRRGGNPAVASIGILLSNPSPDRLVDICGEGGAECARLSNAVWAREQRAADEAYDKSAACGFTSFVAYEYSGGTGLSTLHRNVIFKNDRVPAPVTYMEQPSPLELWRELKAACRERTPGCDVLAIPHNSNESNGQMFFVEYPGAQNTDEERKQAELRAGLEPVIEIYQHKSSSECLNGLSGVVGAPDEQCGFEAPRRDPFVDCGEGRGVGGTTRRGCFSRLDFVRGALLAGLQESERIGTNPYRLGIMASTDTHNGTPGFVDEAGFLGHRGLDDDTSDKRLGPGQLTAGGIEFSPGGLAAVWAEENSRPAIFEGLRRREVYGTSGPRITVRLFGGWAYGASLCDDPELVKKGYQGGVPMGGVLRQPPDGAAPTFVVSALRDPGTATRPGMPLERIQIVKGWLAGGVPHQQVFEVAGGDRAASVDESTCEPSGTGHDLLCAVWRDPTFDPSQPAFYYARVIENPTCRWSTRECNALPAASRPPSCTDPAVPRTVRERAWTSPIWYDR
jgi:hypothetical protein